MIIVVSAVARLAALGAEPFSPCEEGFNVILAGRPPGEIVTACLASNQNPLPILLQKAWRLVAPATTGGDRALSVLLGAAAPAATWCFAAREIGPAGGLIAAALVSASASAILHARLAREYSLLLLLSALAFGAAARRRRLASPAAGGALALALTLGLHTHAAFGGVMIALLALAAFDPSPREALRRLMPPMLLAAALYVPWPVALALREGDPVWHLYRSTGSFLASRLDGSSLAAPAWLFAARDRPAGIDGRVLLAGLLCATLLGAALARRGKPRRLAAAALAPALASSLVFAGLAREDLARARYLLPALPLLAAALAAGAMRARPRRNGVAAVAALALLSLHAAHRHRCGDEEAHLVAAGAAAVAAAARPGDLVVVEPPLIADYYLARPAGFTVRTLRQRDEVGAFTDQPVFGRVESRADLLSAAAAASGVVYWLYPYFDEAAFGNPFARELARRFPSARRIPVGEGHVTRFGREP